MTKISQENFNRFLSEKINIEDNILTENLGTISRSIFSIFERIAHRNELDSRNICANIEESIKSLNSPLDGARKKQLIENLDIMTAKFLKSEKPGKADNCRATIGRIKAFINKKDPITSTPVTQRPSQVTVGTPSRTQSTGSLGSNNSGKPASGSVKAPQTPITIVKQFDSNTLNPQQKLVEAISKRTATIVPGEVIAKSFQADLERIKEIEKKNKITDADRKTMPEYGKLTYQKGSYYFMTLKKEIKCSVPVLKYAYILAEEIEGAITECKKTSQFDVGALLREQAKKMGIACTV